jgi:hypothetical protein
MIPVILSSTLAVVRMNQTARRGTFVAFPLTALKNRTPPDGSRFDNPQGNANGIALTLFNRYREAGHFTDVVISSKDVARTESPLPHWLSNSC